MRRWILLAALAGSTLPGCGRTPLALRTEDADARLLHTAMGHVTDVMVYDIFNPPQASRVYAYASIAAYEALRHGHPEYQTLAGQVNGLAPVPIPEPGVEYHLPLAGVHAFMTVGRALTFSRERMDSLRTEMDERFRRTGISDEVFDRSTAYGDAVAEHILAWSKSDHYAESRGHPKYSVTTEPGRWVPTPPAYMDAIEPSWGTIRPFVMDSGSQFRPAPPYPFDTTAGSPFFREVREVFETTKHLTEEQRAIAAFWDCNPYVMNVRGHAMFATKKITPGGHWMGIAGIAAQESGADPVRTAEVYALTAIALADGFISVWAEKFRSNLLRPETVINTYLDEQWQPLLQTPPFPEYTSGHSGISSAAATVLTELFGDTFAFEDSVEVPYGLPVRSFPSFEAAAAEAAISRLYGGIHYRRAIDEGLVQGRQVGALVLQRVRTRDARTEPTIAARVRGASANPAGH